MIFVYEYHDAAPPYSIAPLMSAILALSDGIAPLARVLDVGCGNGYIAGRFLGLGCHVVGIDPSEQGIAIARASYSKGRFEVMSAGPDMLSNLGEKPFDLVISTEVIEHLYAPRAFVEGCLEALRPDGRLICSTPYHGYLKNLAIAVLDRFDEHVNPLWEGGHIKLWSRRTLSRLFAQAGFGNLRFRGVGRIPYLWKSMILSGDRVR